MAWLQLMLLVLVTMTVSSCAVVGGIFKAGALMGGLAMLLLIVIIGAVVAKIRG